LTFGRSKKCTVVLDEADRGLSRTAGSLHYRDGAWWVQNDSHACLLFVIGDRGFRADLPPGVAMPLQQWHAKLRLTGGAGHYTLLVRLPDEELPDGDDEPGPLPLTAPTDSRAITSVRSRPRLSDSDRLILAARFERYLVWRYPGVATPCTAREAAERIGWGQHAVVKRCENIRERYARLGVPGLRGPRAPGGAGHPAHLHRGADLRRSAAPARPGIARSGIARAAAGQAGPDGQAAQGRISGFARGTEESGELSSPGSVSAVISSGRVGSGQVSLMGREFSCWPPHRYR
jgi:hypothetical protein